MRMDRSSDGVQTPGAEAWALPCGCWAWSWGGVESWIPCHPHVMTHNTRRQIEFSMSYDGFEDAAHTKRAEAACTCLLCLAEKHGGLTPYGYARLVVQQGTNEYLARRTEQAVAEGAEAHFDMKKLYEDTMKIIASETSEKESKSGLLHPVKKSRTRCGCIFTRLHGEWRVSSACRSHKNETREDRRARETRENERRNA